MKSAGRTRRDRRKTGERPGKKPRQKAQSTRTAFSAWGRRPGFSAFSGLVGTRVRPRGIRPGFHVPGPENHARTAGRTALMSAWEAAFGASAFFRAHASALPPFRNADSPVPETRGTVISGRAGCAGRKASSPCHPQKEVPEKSVQRIPRTEKGPRKIPQDGRSARARDGGVRANRRSSRTFSSFSQDRRLTWQSENG